MFEVLQQIFIAWDISHATAQQMCSECLLPLSALPSVVPGVLHDFALIGQPQYLGMGEREEG